MAALETTHPTLMDVAKRLDPNGKVDGVVEVLNQTNEMLEDMVYVEGNLTTGNMHTVRTGLPMPTWRKLYQGVQPTKSETAQVTDTVGNMQAYAEIDKKLADLNGNTAAFRLSEDRAHIEGMSQEHQNTVIFGNEGNEPASFWGLGPRFNDPSAENGDNLLDGGGSGSDNTSIWLVVWDPNKVFGIYPKGSKAGLEMNDMGEVTIENIDGLGGRMQAYRTHYTWDCGLAVKDWRYVVRICNVSKGDLTKDAASGADLVDLMTVALEIPPDLGGRAAFYVNRTVRSFLRRQIRNAKNVNITMDEVAGKKVVMFDEIPVRRVDALAADESLIAFP